MNKFTQWIAIAIGLIIGYAFFRPEVSLKEEPEKKVNVEFIGTPETRFDFDPIGGRVSDVEFSNPSQFTTLNIEKDLQLENKLKLATDRNYQLKLYLNKNLDLENKLNLERKLDVTKNYDLEKRLQLENKILIETIDTSTDLDLETFYDYYVYSQR